jgi:hypothetical protein
MNAVTRDWTMRRCACFFLLVATVGADYLLYSQFLNADCSGPAFFSQATYLQPCVQTGGWWQQGSTSFTFINSTAFSINIFPSLNCTGPPLSSTPSCVFGICTRSGTAGTPTNLPTRAHPTTPAAAQGPMARACPAQPRRLCRVPTGGHQRAFFRAPLRIMQATRPTGARAPFPFSPLPFRRRPQFRLVAQTWVLMVHYRSDSAAMAAALLLKYLAPQTARRAAW